MGALRVGRFSKYLVGEDHDVRIVCAKDQPFAMDHPVEVPTDIIYYSRWRDVNWLPAKVQMVRVWLKRLIGDKTGRDAPASSSPASSSPASSNAVAPDASHPSGLLRRVLNFYRHATNIPDGMIGWLFPALRAGRIATKDWTPDIVFASAPPFTTLIVGRMIAGRTGASLVIEYRDRWMEDPYGLEEPRFRRWLDRKIEEWCARPAESVVTVSEPWAADYKERWGKPVTVAYNGFDQDDMAELDGIVPSSAPRLEIVYTGILYPDRRDPTPLFEALSRMDEARESVKVSFYGANPKPLKQMVARYDLHDVVTIRSRVSFGDSLRLQRAADVLLLLQWNDPLEAGNVPGKLFEYIAARRPVLGIGFEGGVPARILRERGAGQVINDPAEIATFLRTLIARKKAEGIVPLLPNSITEGLSRSDQYAEICKSFQSIARRPE